MVTSSDIRSTTREHFGPLLFTIYFNDFSEVLKHATAYLFADDAKCSYLPFTYPQWSNTLSRRSKQCLYLVQKWNLSFNCTKCTISYFWQEGTEQVTYTLNDSIMESKSSIKDLGVIINSDLSWSDHCQAIISKAYKTLGLLCCTFTTNSILAILFTN